jgi:hypothetical protein
MLGGAMNRRLWQLQNVPHRLRGWQEEAKRLAKIGLNAELRARVRTPDGNWTDLGVASRRVITTVGAGFIVDAFQNLTELETMNFHDSGTGTNAESAGDTGLQTPAGPARATGTQSEPAATQYRTVATITYTTSQNITEHGIFSASTSGVLLDRSVFTAIPVVNGSQIEFTYTLTVSTGT